MTEKKVEIIAEVGVNHDGNLDNAIALIEVAASAGADYVKFQTFVTEQLVTPSAPKAHYQKIGMDANEDQYSMLKRLQLKEQDHVTLMTKCAELGLGFLSTPFDSTSLVFLTQKCGLTTIKLGSGEIDNAKLLLEAARSGAKIILSTGASNLDEVTAALGVLSYGIGKVDMAPSTAAFCSALADDTVQAMLRKKVSILHCTSAYPANVAEANIRAIPNLIKNFGLPVGYSDHTMGSAVAVAAVALGASIIEKHITLDCSLPGPDHRASMEPPEFFRFVSDIRDVASALGDGVKRPIGSEIDNKSIIRKGLYASSDIAEGELIGHGDIAVLRPMSCRSAMTFWDLVGTRAQRAYVAGEMFD